MAMTMQEIFDKVATHLLTQGHPSRADWFDKCLYRGDNGDMCAVGCLIKDEFYDPMLENSACTSKEVMDALFLSDVIAKPNKRSPNSPAAHGYYERTDEIQLLRDLQEVHDGRKPESWRGELITLAHHHGLNPNVLE